MTCLNLQSAGADRQRSKLKPLFWLRQCSQTAFDRLSEAEHVQGIRVGALGFQKLKEPLR
jgi:hypothetical protein